MRSKCSSRWARTATSRRSCRRLRRRCQPLQPAGQPLRPSPDGARATSTTASASSATTGSPARCADARSPLHVITLMLLTYSNAALGFVCLRECCMAGLIHPAQGSVYWNCMNKFTLVRLMSAWVLAPPRSRSQQPASIASTYVQVLLDCGHGGLCRRCGQLMFARPPHQCPVCRQAVSAIVQLTHRLHVGDAAASVCYPARP